MTPDKYCRDRVAQSGSSFYYSFLFLPPERRSAIIALYAFCREVDDVVDNMNDPDIARAKLAWWRQEIGLIYAGRRNIPSRAPCRRSSRVTRCPKHISRRSSTA